MESQQEQNSLLGPYRVLDLTDEKGWMCGKVLADLGADVIKIEPLGGDPGRKIGPFYKDIPDPQKSLYWFWGNLNKRGITLNLETKGGQGLFRELVGKADFVVESFEPGHMEGLELGYGELSRINPRVILTSITPYGQKGPHAHHKASDMVLWARGGIMYLTGDPDRPPVRVSLPQAYLHGGVEGAVASLAAHYHREDSGEGQHVDVSIQESVIWTNMDTTGYWDLNRINRTRGGRDMVFPNITIRGMWPCKDGYVTFFVMGGTQSMANAMKALVAWMDEEGAAPDWLKAMNWTEDYDRTKITQEDVNRVQGPIARFIATKTKAELFDQAVKRRFILAPVANAKDILGSPQLADREYFIQVEHPELGETLTYPGPFLQLSETPIKINRRAPLIGEHNDEVYGSLLGLSKEKLVALKGTGVI